MTFKKTPLLIVLLLLTLFNKCIAFDRAIAITIDDLPFVGDKGNFHLNLIIDCLQKKHIPVTGFIIADRVNPHNAHVLQRFHDAGLGLGNHTLSHMNLNQVDTETYLNNIEQADQILKPFITEPKFFRYPYLAMGQGEKKTKVLYYLEEQQYHIAPITIDSKDFIFNQQLLSVSEIDRREFFKELLPVYLDYLYIQTLDAEQLHQKKRQQAHPRAEILLIHANLLNAYALCDVISLYEQMGYHFVSLEEALQ